ncbi:hypothetical protein PsorP6_009658 [Peronosclerospora sorghi]|uniref:Uncharacterized protein n=1 Tax=Peronosclerospora sorghi TaxID=230839 RepID=A0ACC0VZX7_9STRA|nr:hypothetical protein PsorP6_009658 [Peronosclerospora sorghi]
MCVPFTIQLIRSFECGVGTAVVPIVDTKSEDDAWLLLLDLDGELLVVAETCGGGIGVVGVVLRFPSTESC